MQNITNTWDFVEKYYPNYSSSDEIAENDDLQKVVDGQLEEGEEAFNIYNEIKNELKDLFHAEPEESMIIEIAQKRLHESNSYVFEKAIEGYIESLKTSQPVFWSVEDFEAKAEENFKSLKEDNPKEYQHLVNWEQLYDKSKFPEQLQRMVASHDANEGINWQTIEAYLGNCEIK